MSNTKRMSKILMDAYFELFGSGDHPFAPQLQIQLEVNIVVAIMNTHDRRRAPRA